MEKKTFAHFDASRTIVCYWSDKTAEIVFEGSAMDWLQDERTLTLKEFYQSLLNQSNFDTIQPFIIWLNRHFLPFISKRKDFDIYPKVQGHILIKNVRVRTLVQHDQTFYHFGSLCRCLALGSQQTPIGAYNEVIKADHPLNTGNSNYFVSYLWLLKKLTNTKEDAIYLNLKRFLDSITHQSPVILSPDAIDLYVSIFQNPIPNKDVVFENWWTFVTGAITFDS